MDNRPNVVRLHDRQPVDYPEPFRFVPSRNAPLTFGERVVLFFQLNGEAISFWFAMLAIGFAVAVVAGAYVGVGR